MRLRPAVPADAWPLAALKRTTFRQTFVDGFAIPYPPDELALFEAAVYSPAAVTAELADPEVAQWVVEAEGGRLVGYAKVGPCTLPHPDVTPGAGELKQLYLLDEAQGQGLGLALFDTALAHLAATRPGPVWLGVWSGNYRAQTFYTDRGFTPAGTYRFRVGRAWEDEEYIFRRG